MIDPDLQQLLQAGGLGVLSVLVYLELRAIRPVLSGLQLALTALLERERYRDGDTPRNYPALRRAPTEPPQ